MPSHGSVNPTSSMVGPELTSMVPSNTLDQTEPEGHSGEELDANVPSPHRTLSVSLEEVEDEDLHNTPSGHPTTSTIMEEVEARVEDEVEAGVKDEDEDMPQTPGPHPFANPTPGHLYTEPHPDPTAGVPLRFFPADRTAMPLYTSVLVEPDTFKEAYWLDNLPIPQSDEAQYFKLLRVRLSISLFDRGSDGVQ
ncbi:hypothetical protein FRC10_012001 [Ceratobasidium sp. 414]|nr:hypothetical protein FRC10_012001 [Ceratobasidium sp. 414]